MSDRVGEGQAGKKSSRVCDRCQRRIRYYWPADNGGSPLYVIHRDKAGAFCPGSHDVVEDTNAD